MSEPSIKPVPLDQSNFDEFGEVIETEGKDFTLINDGSAQNFSELANIDVLSEGGYPRVSIYESNPLQQPIKLTLLERHPLGSQAFIPLSSAPFLVVVASEASPDKVRAFITNGRQGVNFKANTWHHPLLVLEPQCRFLVIDRGGKGDNCEIQDLSKALTLNL